jgi:hypothetical protein
MTDQQWFQCPEENCQLRVWVDDDDERYASMEFPHDHCPATVLMASK